MRKKTLHDMPKLITAIGMTLAAFTMLTTASYAWFSRNRITDVNGIGFITRGYGTNIKITKGHCTDPDLFPEDEVYEEQNAGALLQPVSSTNGTDFFANTNFRNTVNGNGITTAGAKFEKINGDDLTSYYSTFEKYMLGIKDEKVSVYVDYTYSILVNCDERGEDNVNIYLQDVMLTYSGNDITNGYALNAFRVGVFTEAYDMETETWGEVENHGLLCTANASYFAENQAINGVSYENQTLVRSDIESFDNKPLKTYEGGIGDQIFAITLRIWLEGEDQACNSSTFQSLTDDYLLTMKLGLDEPTENVVIK